MLQDMQAELRGQVPKLDYSFCKTLINRAYRTIRERNLWSFLLFEGQWIAPPQFVGVAATTVQGSASVTLSTADTTALSAALTAQPYSPITRRQFRIGASGIYSIWNESITAGRMTLTLDRWYGEPSGTQAFTIYQCYYVPTVANSPILDFKTWKTVRDIQDFRSLFTSRYTRSDLDMQDPQRTWYGIPTDVVPFANDQNPQSASYGAMMYELWGAPTFPVNYQLYGLRGGSDLVSPTDKLPYALGEDAVIALAKVYAYQWAEANKELAPRNVGPDWKFLMGAANQEYEAHLKLYRMADRERVDNWFLQHRIGRVWPEAHYSTQSGYANPGGGYG